MYLWLKAFHIIFMVAWFAELFYIFRLFVYHVKFRERPGIHKAYEEMEYRLIYFIGHPAMGLTLIFGILLLVFRPDLLAMSWMLAKLAAVLFLMAYQIFAGSVRRKFKEGNYFLSEKACRIINEVPTVLLIVIILLVVLKP